MFEEVKPCILRTISKSEKQISIKDILTMSCNDERTLNDKFSGCDLDGLFPGALHVRQLPGHHHLREPGSGRRRQGVGHQLPGLEGGAVHPGPWPPAETHAVGADAGHHRVVGLGVRHQPGHGPAILHCAEKLPGDDSDDSNNNDDDDHWGDHCAQA